MSRETELKNIQKRDAALFDPLRLWNGYMDVWVAYGVTVRSECPLA